MDFANEKVMVTADRDSELMVYSDGGAVPNPGDKGIGIVIKKNGSTLKKVSVKGGKGSNNEAEYEALLSAMKTVLDMGYTKAKFHTDSILVYKQIQNEWEIKSSNLRKYVEMIQELIPKFKSFKIIKIPRSENKEADNLASLALI